MQALIPIRKCRVVMASVVFVMSALSVASFAPTSRTFRSILASDRSIVPFTPLVDNGVRSVFKTTTSLNLSAFDGIKGPIQSYVDIWTPLFQQAQDAGLVPDFLLHWGHGAAMATVLLTMGVFGSYLGWQIRLGNGNDSNQLTLGETVREAHPKVIGGALFFFLLGGQGGLVLYDFQGGDILSSPHAVTAIVSIGLLIIQAILPKFFDRGGQAARDVHAYLGSATMVALFAHMVTGIKLGLSF